jgi:hypothetical protein
MAWMRAMLRRTMSRRGAVLAVLGAGLILLLSWRPQFGPDTFDQLHEGMTTEEVGTILGCPPGDYRPTIWREPDWFVSHGDIIYLPREERGRPVRELELQKQKEIGDWLKTGGQEPAIRFYRYHWWGRRYGIEVAFDSSGRLIGWVLLEMLRPREPQDLLRKLRWWLGV